MHSTGMLSCFTSKYQCVIQSIIGDGPVEPVIQPVTIDTMLNNNGLNIGDGLNFVTCEQTLTESSNFQTIRGL